MKNIVKIILVVIIGSMMSCEKFQFDRRGQYLGDYNFTVSTYTWDMNSGNGPVQVYDMPGEIDCIKDQKDNIILRVGYQLKINCLFDASGEIISCGGSGQLNKDGTMKFSYSTMACEGSGLGSGTYFDIIGQKQ